MSIEKSDLDRSKLIKMEKTEKKQDEIGNPLMWDFKGTKEAQISERRRRILEKYRFTDAKYKAKALFWERKCIQK